MSLNKALKWRYAVKKYTDQKVSDADLNTILENINLSASSVGLQPYRVILVDNPAIRQQLAEGGFNAQIAEASHLLVFAAIENLDETHVDAYMARTAEVRGVEVEQLAPFKNMIVGSLSARTAAENFVWASKQAYIGLGTGLASAAELEIDATPMEGFDPTKFDAILGLKEKGLSSVVLLSLGYRDAEKDHYAIAPKVRLPLDEFVQFVK